MQTHYEPKVFEAKRYKKWLEKKCFSTSISDTANSPTKKPYCIPMPPPNVTGILHIGHALFVAIQDTLVRWERMHESHALWTPGLDHAGIATQMIVEKNLLQEGITRHKLGREAFLKKVFAWKNDHGEKIIDQMQSLGASADWDLLRFTMDPVCSQAVRQAFAQLYHEGLIYKDAYITNRCTRCETVLSDLEVTSTTRASHLWHICYYNPQQKPTITIATSRPETVLADVAIAVHPEDPRYQHLIGTSVIVPLTDRAIPIIADTYVDQAFGSGALKITPGHDFNDYRIGKNHGLPHLQVINEKGFMNASTGIYAGLTVAAARTAIVRDLAHHLITTEAIEQQVQTCQRCESVLEPLISKQWFMKTKNLAASVIQAAQKGEALSEGALEHTDHAFKILPAIYYGSFYHWMENIEDWCISRQLWWGHQIPAWTCDTCHKLTVPISPLEDPTHCDYCQATTLTRDPDVLDTWFSSALWPFASLGWPDTTPLLQTFYPSSVLETGFDILFFWVARMLMLGIHLTGKVPFKKVYLHSMVRDEKGQKMSKTKGNVIDPLELIDRYGADPLRAALLQACHSGKDIRISDERVKEQKAFCNKLWNASRFVFMKMHWLPQLTENAYQPLHPLSWKSFWEQQPSLHPLHLAFAAKFLSIVKSTQEHLDAFKMSEAFQNVMQWTWNDFCDWYIEATKEHLKDAALRESTQFCLLFFLHQTLHLVHPFLPFVSEEIFQHLQSYLGIPENTHMLMLQDHAADMTHTATQYASLQQAYEGFILCKETVDSLRTYRSVSQVPVAAKPDIYYHSTDAQVLELVKPFEKLIASLSQSACFKTTASPPTQVAEILTSWSKLYVVVSDIKDLQEEKARITKALAQKKLDLTHITQKLSNPLFLEKAPIALVEETKAKQHLLENHIQSLEALWDKLS